MAHHPFREFPSASASVIIDVGGGEGNGVINGIKEKRCQFWLSRKRRHCANSPLPHSMFCGNHDPSSGDRRIPCPLDPSHSVSKENLKSHLKRCPLRKKALALETQIYYSKGINRNSIKSEEDNISSEAKRKAIYGMKLVEFLELVKKIESLHSSIVVDLKDSCVMPDACQKWLRRQIDSKIPYQEKHVLQQASILGNMERFRILHSPKEKLIGLAHKEGMEEDNSAWNDDVPAVVEFGAGRGYLTQMLADSYGIHRIFLVERKSYKLKADRSLRQNESISLKRLRIDIEDLDLHAVESLNGHPFLAIGKHLCGSATDLAIRCCCPGQNNLNKKTLLSSCYLQGIAIATCCHHLCQWKHYLNASYFLDWGMTREEFHAITWFSSWAVDGDHGSNPSILADSSMEPNSSEVNESGPQSVEEAIRNMKHAERAALGFKCKDVIDMGRIIWLREQGFIAELVKYVPSRISPENHLLLAKLKLPFIVRE